MRTMNASSIMRCGVGGGPSRPAVSSDSFIERMMVFDENHDGELTRSEITDTRLVRLFDRADAAVFVGGFGPGGGGMPRPPRQP